MHLKNLTDAFAGFASAGRPIRLRLSQEQHVLGDALLVKRASGHETLCGALEYRILCVSTRADLALKEFIALPVELQFVTDRGDLRSVCGIVAQAAAGQSDGGFATYELVMRDALALMEQRTNTPVFRNRNELDITQIILDEWRQTNPVLARAFDVDWSRVSGSYPAREFTMQHNESDADFLRRLWKRRGIAWHMRPGQASDPRRDDMPGHILVLFDDAYTLPQNAAGTVRYHRDDATEQSDTIIAWSPVRMLRPGIANRLSWDYLQARPMAGSSSSCVDQGPIGNRFAASLDDYLIDMPHAGADGNDYRQLGELRMKRHEYEAKCFHGEGSVRALCVGEWIGLSGHPEVDTHPENERQFIVTRLEIDAVNNLPKTIDERVKRLFALSRWDAGSPGEALGQASDERGMRYTNRFSCVRRGIPIVPAFDPRSDLPQPRLQSAIVVGPAGEEVHCDEYGRVKVRFPGTRSEDHGHAQGAGASDSDRDSAWVRVASTWASNQWGAITLPRVGDEVIVDFLGGDPDKPIIVGQVYGGIAPPPSFSHTGTLPGNRYLAGIKSKEVQGTRYNQLRLDDTPGQINAQLSSQHGHSELNLGWLTEPRNKGAGKARGEGAELRSDNAVAVRGAQGVFISAAARPKAGGKQLDRPELIGLVEAMQGVQRQLAELAATHHADDTDDKELAQLIGYLKTWEAGSNTDEDGEGGGGQPVVAVSAPAGVAITSQDNIAIGAQTHVDLVSIGNTQLSVGKKLLARVSDSISLFAHRLGIKLIAASGKIDMQTHAGDIELTSAKRIVLTATEEIVLQAPKVRVVAKGAQVDIGGGAITEQCSGDHTIKSAKFAHVKPGDGSPAAVTLPTSETAHDQQTVLRWIGTDEPIKNQRYRITTEDGRTFEGRTDANGMTERFTSSIPFGRYSIEALDDWSQKDEPMPTAEYPLPAQQNKDAARKAEGFATPKQDKKPQCARMLPKRVLPVIFPPGIMGSNLRMSEQRQKELKQKDNIAWRPDVLGAGNAHKNATMTPSERQLRLDPLQTTVDIYDPSGKAEVSGDGRHANVKFDEGFSSPLLQSDPLVMLKRRTAVQKARARGWGEVFFKSYGGLLQHLESRLNNTFSDGAVRPEWKDVVGVDPQVWMPHPSRPQKPLTEAELKAVADGCWFAVYAFGYNWLQSNGDSARIIATRINKVIADLTESGYECNQVIVVTHSMGGLVGRALIHPAYGNLQDKVLGIVHGVMPAIGAPAAYKRMRAGFEDPGMLSTSASVRETSVTAKVLGNYGDEVTAVLANSQGGLQLLPTEAYGNGWLRVRHDGHDLDTWPKNGDPYNEIYKVRKKWYALFREEWINPSDRSPDKGGGSFERTYGYLDKVQGFHQMIANTYHPNSYAHYGADIKHQSFGEVVWEIRNCTDSTGWQGWPIVDDTRQGRLELVPWDKGDVNNIGALPFNDASPNPVYAEILPPSAAGDQTVPAQSADHQLNSSVFKGIFRQTGYEHQSSYKDPRAIASTLYSIVRIAQEATWECKKG